MHAYIVAYIEDITDDRLLHVFGTIPLQHFKAALMSEELVREKFGWQR
jgi:hypothetical protein